MILYKISSYNSSACENSKSNSNHIRLVSIHNNLLRSILLTVIDRMMRCVWLSSTSRRMPRNWLRAIVPFLFMAFCGFIVNLKSLWHRCNGTAAFEAIRRPRTTTSSRLSRQLLLRAEVNDWRRCCESITLCAPIRFDLVSIARTRFESNDESFIFSSSAPMCERVTIVYFILFYFLLQSDLANRKFSTERYEQVSFAHIVVAVTTVAPAVWVNVVA